ncbi:odorant receptor 49b isoform X2 [Tribolium castaneum]|uniref:Odorant receptor n=1 Tax=Tribolium castaneum TaxID=7070 RepID=A0A139WAJ5_TRICA|nr:PREDICTED: odorant receptor 49b-like isoform X2 [Tribolium castaneum]KYB24944.1 Odorant receptor 30a-like protein [Tribolium castaneum]|eukprot:XP_008200336.2 PREDICTED: odorant receptor 49b-like isoform X2 [Tribolium castaneum]
MVHFPSQKRPLKDDPFQYLRRCLEPWGQKPSLLPLCLLILLIKIFFFTARTVFILKWMKEIDVLEISVTWPVPLLVVIKMCYTLYQRDKIGFLFRSVTEKFWDLGVGGPGLEKELEKRFKLINRFLFGHVSLGVFYVGLYAFFADVPIPKGRTRWLPVLASMPFDQDQSPQYEILYVLMYWNLVVSILGHGVFDMVFIYSSQHLVGQFILLKALLRKLDYGFEGLEIVAKARSRQFQKEIRKRIAICVQHHNLLLAYGNELKKIASMIFGVHVLSTSLTLILVGYILSKNLEKILQYSMLLSGVVSEALQFIIFAVQSGEIYHKSVSVAQAAYQSNWYVFNAKAKRDLTLLILNSQKGISMYGAGLVTINNEILVSMIQKIFSSITLLRSLGEQK